MFERVGRLLWERKNGRSNSSVISVPRESLEVQVCNEAKEVADGKMRSSLSEGHVRNPRVGTNEQR